jgi:hypothetical protein
MSKTRSGATSENLQHKSADQTYQNIDEKLPISTYLRKSLLVARLFLSLFTITPVRVIDNCSSATHALSQSQIVGNSLSKYSIDAHPSWLAAICGRTMSDMNLVHNIVKLHIPKTDEAITYRTLSTSRNLARREKRAMVRELRHNPTIKNRITNAKHNCTLAG